MTARRITAAACSLTLLLLVTVGVPTLMIRLGSIPHSLPTPAAVLSSLTSPDTTGTYFQIAAAAVVWIAWAVFTAASITEIARTVRYRAIRPTQPRHGVSVLAPVSLVTAIAILFIAGPAQLTDAHADAAALHTVLPSSMSTLENSPLSAVETVPAPREDPRDATEQAHDLPTYLVRRYDTLWSIAQRHLPGDPATRYRDIRELNPHVIHNDNEIRTGSLLVMPADAHGLPDTPQTQELTGETITVAPGDTLTALATRAGLSDWHPTWTANRGRPEPDGQTFTNPDLLQPGWTLSLPARAHDSTHRPATAVPAPSAPRLNNSQERREHHRTEDHSPSPMTETGNSHPATTQPSVVTTTHTKGSAWEATFAGAGSLLAAGLLTMLVTRRRQQARFRRPGNVTPATPSPLVDTDRAIRTHGTCARASVAALEQALLTLTASLRTDPEATPPQLLAARLIDDRIEVILGEPISTGPPPPWAAAAQDRTWTTLVTDLPEPSLEDQPAPYPLLVAVGHQADGSNWLLDLEQLRTLTVAGETRSILNFARFIAAELAVNHWSRDVTVTLVGFGQDLVHLNPARLQHSYNLRETIKQLRSDLTAKKTTAQALQADSVTGRTHLIAGDSWHPHILLIAEDETADAVNELNPLLQELGQTPGRTGIAVVRLGTAHDRPEHGWHAELRPDGHLIIDRLNLEVTAEQLPSDQVEALGQLIAHTEQLFDEPAPASSGHTPHEALSTVTGALRSELTDSRTSTDIKAGGRGTGPAEESSANSASTTGAVAPRARTLLQHNDARYLAQGASTVEDLHTLAPLVEPEISSAVLAADPTLDDDLADWLDPSSTTPKLIVLGPVELRAHGDRPTKRVAYFTELITYLATREHGATAEQIGAAFDVSISSVYSRINTARAWLGTNPQTGEKHLPDSAKSTAGKARGVGVYQLKGVAVDADLFKRLRLRAQALGGPAGIHYLQAALNLVTGEPFAQLRPGGYGWLSDTPLDHYLASAIVDVSHIVHLHHLEQQNLPAARAAAELALRAAPYEEIPRLDLVAVMQAEGHHEEANLYLREGICNRNDDSDGPEDLPPRTANIVQDRGWLHRAS